MSLIEQLPKRFDTRFQLFDIGGSRMFFVFCMEVQDCLGFQCMGKNVDTHDLSDKNIEQSTLVLKEYFPDLDLRKLSKTTALNKIRTFPMDVDGWNDDFLRLCICYMFSIFFFP